RWGASYRPCATLFHQIPFDPDYPLVFEPLQRFRKKEITCGFRLFKPNDAEFSTGIALLNRNYPMVLQRTLEMSVGGWLLPESIWFRCPGIFDDIGKSDRF